ncbi:ADAMTS-like no long nerve cord [Augochlora pura]
MRNSCLVPGCRKGCRGASAIFFIGICLLGLVVSDNSTIGDSITEDVAEVSNASNNLDADTVEQSVAWGEWSPWSKWSGCSRSCGGGVSRQQRRCRRKPCKGRPWSTKYKVCNPELMKAKARAASSLRNTRWLAATKRKRCYRAAASPLILFYLSRWVAGEWGICSASCGGGSRTRAIFCTEENGNETTKLPDHKCSGMHKPRNQETCNTISCPMWETNKWSECSVTCGTGTKTRTVECRDAVGSISADCDPAERPHTEQECKTNIACPIYGDEMTQPLMQPYPPPPVSEKLIDQPIPSESTFIADEWSPCSVTCGEGIRRRDVRCKIFLEFSRTIADLPDRQCSGPKPIETEKCAMEPCGMMENSLSYGIDAVGDSGYAEPSLTDTYRSSGGSSSGGGYESRIKVASGSDAQTTYSWKETGYTPCSATCLGGVQDLIINCIQDDTGKPVIPLLCTSETKPEARIRVCNDNPCPPRWNLSEFSQCMSPCGLGIQTRYVTCIHEVTRGSTGKTVPVPNKMCPQPPPADRQYCNVFDCPVKWNVGKWSKCSKTCGGGVMKREVSCGQIMAQGRQQSREDRECMSQKPATERPCNNRACHDTDGGSLPIISSQNTTYNQTELNAKVDLKIGGTAKIFQGTPFIKIRCPVRKFDKAQIIWTKDNKELRKSRKYKISRKGALKINDITASDAGVYACIAGNSHAQTQLIVKFRSKGQISSEEYLRLSNSVYLQRNANLDSAPVNSGESLYTDQAAYGNRFIPIDSEEINPNNKPTKKPQKKQRPNPTPPDSTDLRREQTVTSQNQPGYHESVESTASSSASTLVPHLTHLISSLKEYWPFQSESSAGRSHRTAPVSFVDDTRKEAAPTKHTQVRYQNMEDNLDTLYRNTAIPDETFGPDEERIFIGVDPYDLDDTMFGLEHSDPVRITPVAGKEAPVTSAISDNDYVVESLRNVKRQWQEPQDKGHTTQHSKEHAKDVVVPSTVSDDIGLEVFYIPDSTSTKHAEIPRKETDRGHRVTAEIEHVFSTMSLKELEEPRKSDREKGVSNRTEDYAEELEDEMKKRKTYLANDTVDDSVTWASTRDPEEDLSELALSGVKGSNASEKDPEERTRPMNVESQNGSEEEAIDFDDSEEKKNKSSSVAGAASCNTTADTSLATLSILDSSEDLVFEWVTTEWSKCSQTCGRGGFQIRGAQCTVRSAKPPGNSTRSQTRVVIGDKLCEDAGHPMVQKVRSCGSGECPQWHTTEWTPCQTSRCFNWKTAMQRRDVTCRLDSDVDSDPQNVTLLDPGKCDETTRPLQRQECYNDACKGVWRVGEWSECMAPCEKDGIKYRILRCVWFGTKKPAGNACRDIPRPPVMKTCKSPPCSHTADDCKDHPQLCTRERSLTLCKMRLYRLQCCRSCQLEGIAESDKPEKSR